MVTKTDIELKNFFIFNSTLGPKEGEVCMQLIFFKYLPFSFKGTEKDTLLLSLY